MNSLRLPGVVPVAVLLSSEIAALMTPLAFWAFKPGHKNFPYHGSGLFTLLSVYIVLVTPKSPGLGLYGSVGLAITGLAIIGILQRQ